MTTLAQTLATASQAVADLIEDARADGYLVLVPERQGAAELEGTVFYGVEIYERVL